MMMLMPQNKLIVVNERTEPDKGKMSSIAMAKIIQLRGINSLGNLCPNLPNRKDPNKPAPPKHNNKVVV